MRKVEERGYLRLGGYERGNRVDMRWRTKASLPWNISRDI
jgi:hypothetical protein